MITKQRDTQRARVYKADADLLPFSRADVSTVPLMEAYVRKVWTSKRVREAFPLADNQPRVRDGRARRHAGATDRWVAVPKWARRESIVVHELAHTITQRVYGYEVAGHGWQYCSVFLKLTLYMMGRPAFEALKAAFKRHRVRFTEPRKRKPLTPEQRAALTARLTTARRNAQVMREANQRWSGVAS